MSRPRRTGWIARIAVAGALSLAAISLGAGGSPDGTAAALSRWTGGIDLYRSGVFTTQQTWLWCTAADVQIARNIVDHATDHSRSSQQRYFDYMRAHDSYAIPLKDGVDPGGWTAGLRHFVDGRYRLVASHSFDAALRSAVTNLRRTNRPVGITVSHGNHAWLLTGFTATADPATTTRFTVTSVRVVGPLWGLQSRSYGYDMKPDTRLTPAQLKGFFTPWHYAGVRMAWEGDWVSIQPIAAAATSPPPAATPKPTPRPTPKPTARPTATPSPAASGPASPDSVPPASGVPASVSPVDPSRDVAAANVAAAPGGSPPPDSGAPSGAAWTIVITAAAAAGLALAGTIAVRRARLR